MHRPYLLPYLQLAVLYLVVASAGAPGAQPERHPHDNPHADRLFSEAEMVGWVKAQVRLGMRQPGSPAEQANEKYVLGELKRMGLDAHAEVVHDLLALEATPESAGEVGPGRKADPQKPLVYWSPDLERSELRVFDAKGGARGTKVRSYPVPHTAFLDSHVQPLVYADANEGFEGVVEAWRGRIVVTDITFPPIPADKFLKLAESFGIWDPDGTLEQMNHPATWVRKGWELYDIASRSGAAGFIGILANQPGGDVRMYAPYGFKERDILNKPIPAVWVGKADRDWLKDAASRGVAASLKNVGTTRRTQAFNIVAEIPGRGEQAIIIDSHTDSPFYSPVEDASGAAVVLALAKHFSERAKKHGPLNRRLIFVLSAGHFYGSVGTRSFIHSHPELVRPDADGNRKAVLEISIEHIAREAEENEAGKLVPHPDVNHPSGRPEPTAIFISYNDAIRDAVLGAVKHYNLDRTVLLGANGPLGAFPPTNGGDWFTAGIPTINHISNPVYLLTDSGDAIDPATGRFRWLASERFTKTAAAYREVILRLDKVSREDLYADGIALGWWKDQIGKWLIGH